MPDSLSTARRRLIPPSNPRRDGYGVQPGTATGRRWRLSQLRAKRTIAIDPASNEPRFTPPLLVDQTPHDGRHTMTGTPGGSGRGALPPRPPEIYRGGANLGDEQQKRDAARHPVSDLGPRVGARVASGRRPILRSGRCPFYLRSHRGTSRGARPAHKTMPTGLPRGESRDALNLTFGDVS